MGQVMAQTPLLKLFYSKVECSFNTRLKEIAGRIVTTSLSFDFMSVCSDKNCTDIFTSVG